MKFTASIDKLTQIITFITIVSFVGISIYLLGYAPSASTYGKASLCIGFLLLFIAFFLHPQHYFIDDNSLVVKSPFFSRSISTLDIIEVTALQPEELRGSIRAFGSGGFFGYFGLFYNLQYKWMIWFATQRKNYVLVKTAKRKFVFTPDNQEAFVATLRNS